MAKFNENVLGHSPAKSPAHKLHASNHRVQIAALPKRGRNALLQKRQFNHANTATAHRRRIQSRSTLRDEYSHPTQLEHQDSFR